MPFVPLKQQCQITEKKVWPRYHNLLNRW